MALTSHASWLFLCLLRVGVARTRRAPCAYSESQTAVRGMLHRDPSAALRKSLEDPPIFCKDEAVKVSRVLRNPHGCTYGPSVHVGARSRRQPALARVRVQVVGEVSASRF